VTIERRSPLPVGRYWVDTFKRDDKDEPALMNAWLRAVGDAVHTITTEEESDSDPPRTWYLFEVRQEGAASNPSAFGVTPPTVAGPEIQTSEDTIQAPRVEDLDDHPLESAGKLLIIGGGLLLGVLLLSNVASLVKAFKK
jgi:hypothetical protein